MNNETNTNIGAVTKTFSKLIRIQIETRCDDTGVMEEGRGKIIWGTPFFHDYRW
jgi:hypothetical protein